MQQLPVYDYCLLFEKTHTHILSVPYPVFLSIPLSLFTLMLNICIKISPLEPWICFNLKFFSEAYPRILVLLENRSLKRLENSLRLLRGTAWSCVSYSVTIDSQRISSTVSLHKVLRCILVSRLSQSPGPSQLSQWHLTQQISESQLGQLLRRESKLTTARASNGKLSSFTPNEGDMDWSVILFPTFPIDKHS